MLNRLNYNLDGLYTHSIWSETESDREINAFFLLKLDYSLFLMRCDDLLHIKVGAHSPSTLLV